MSTIVQPIPRAIGGLQDIAADYDAAFVDVWGVVHDGRAPYMAAVEACRAFRAERGPVILVSNSPRPGDKIPEQFESIGVPTDFFDAIATSGDATKAELARRAPGPAFKLGPDRDEHIYTGTGLAFAPFEEAAFVSCTGLFDDERETPANYVELLGAARARDLVMVCANPDVAFKRGDRVLYAAGALAQAYEALGGTVILCGKPHAPIYTQAFAQLEALRPGTARARVLAIGDGPDTDLAGANAQALDALFIAGGLHGAELSGGDDAVAQFLAEKGRCALFAAPALTW